MLILGFLSIFPVRGQPDQDREYRHPRLRAEKQKRRDLTKVRREILDDPGSSRSSLSTAQPALARLADDWGLLPPLPETIEAVKKFTSNYFQLGFIPKHLFPERLRTQHRSVSVLFLLGVLSISARLTPALVERYGSAVRASEVFMERASVLAQHEVYKDPSLERCQAFYLLSIAQQGSGMKHRSSVSDPALPTAPCLRLTNRLKDQHGDCNADGDLDAIASGGDVQLDEPHKGTYHPG